MAEATESTSGRPPITKNSKIRLETSKGSALAIGFYPTFKYNASGGGGFGRVTGISGSRAFVEFDHKELYIPTLGWRTAIWLYAPLPPVFKIQITPSKLQGWIDTQSGEVELNLSADFNFSAARFYKVSLHVDTKLTTEAVKSRHHDKHGSRLDRRGQTVLVGVGDVEKSGSFIDKVLRLPTDVLGLMKAEIDWDTGRSCL